MATVPPPPAEHTSRDQAQLPWVASRSGSNDAADDDVPPLSALPSANAAPIANAAAAVAASASNTTAVLTLRTLDQITSAFNVPREVSRRAIEECAPEDATACDNSILDNSEATDRGGPAVLKSDGPHVKSHVGSQRKTHHAGGEGRTKVATKNPPPDENHLLGTGVDLMTSPYELDDFGASFRGDGTRRKRSRSEDGDRDIDDDAVVGRLKREEDYEPRRTINKSPSEAMDAAQNSNALADVEDKSSFRERKSSEPQKLPPGQVHATVPSNVNAEKSRDENKCNADQIDATMPSTHDPQTNNDADSENSSEDESYKKSHSDESSGDSSSDDEGEYAGQAALIASIIRSQNNPALRAYLARLHSLDSTSTEEVVRPPSFPDGPPSFPDGVADFLKSPQCKSIVVLSGAGMSVASGIPDFRSAGTGLYDTLRPELLTATELERDAIEEDPTLALDRGLFLTNPLPMLETKRGFILGTHARRWRATLAHRFVAMLNAKLPGKLTRVYTQNIDGLEMQCDGLPREKVVCVHGSMASAACEVCGAEMDFDEFCSEVRAKVKDITGEDRAAPQESAPIVCRCGEPMVKPTIVLFRGSMPNEFHRRVAQDLPECDLLIVIGTSLTVAPANSLVYRIPPTALRLVMNNEKVGRRLGIDYGDDAVRDVYAHGHSDETCLNLAEQMGWLEDLAAIADDLPDSSAQLLRERLDRRRQSEKPLPEMK